MKILDICILVFIILHASLMLFDEFFFHRKRGLPTWERIGHPIDTLSTILCFIIVIFLPMTKISFIFYIILSIFSCLLIAKDEFIHLKCCERYEQYLHALLFIMHPIFLGVLFISWPCFSQPLFSFMVIFKSDILAFIIYAQFISVLIFFFYQIVYWNLYFKGSTYVSKGNNK